MTIERGESLLGMMLMTLSDRHISIRNNIHAFFIDTGEYKIVILPEGRKMNSTYFIECAAPFDRNLLSAGRGDT
jgi:hypothetical protein